MAISFEGHLTSFDGYLTSIFSMAVVIAVPLIYCFPQEFNDLSNIILKRFGKAFGQFMMGSSQPRFNISAKLGCQKKHLFGFLIGCRSCPFITADVSFLPKLIKLGNKTRGDADGIGKGLNDPVVVSFTHRPVTGSGKGGCCCLQGGIIGDIQAPIWAQAGRLAIGKITIRHRK
jgi:hypothetical protein